MALAQKNTQEIAQDSYSLFRNNLLAFIRWTYPEYEVSAHHVQIANALEKVDRGEITNLIITCPPQKGKTEALIRFILWVYARNPNKRIVYGTYGADRAEMVSGEIRDATQTEEFKALFPHLSLASDSKSKAHWKFAGTLGYVHAVGVGGPSTGFTSDLSVIDDFYKDAEEAESELIREKVWTWMKAVISTRKRVAKVPTIILCTRWHMDDVIGRLLKEQPDLWTVVHFKALDGPEEDIPLWPERWSLKDYQAIKADVGPRVWSALYQGDPIPKEGLLFKEEWLRIVESEPVLVRWVRAWDLSAMIKTRGDYTAGARVGIDEEGRIHIADVVRFRAEWPEARRHIIDTAVEDPRGTLVGIEEVAWQLAMIQDLQDNDVFLRVPLYKLKPDRDKEARAAAWASRAERGKLVLTRGSWNVDFINEALSFPFGANDDQVDAVSYAVNLLLKMRGQYVRHEVAPKNTTWDYFKKLAGIKDPEEDGDWYG